MNGNIVSRLQNLKKLTPAVIFFTNILFCTKKKMCSFFTHFFYTERTFVWCQMSRKMVNTFWFRFDWKRFRKNFEIGCCFSSHCLHARSIKLKTRLHRNFSSKVGNVSWVNIVDGLNCCNLYCETWVILHLVSHCWVNSFFFLIKW